MIMNSVSGNSTDTADAAKLMKRAGAFVYAFVASKECLVAKESCEVLEVGNYAYGSIGVANIVRHFGFIAFVWGVLQGIALTDCPSEEIIGALETACVEIVDKKKVYWPHAYSVAQTCIAHPESMPVSSRKRIHGLGTNSKW